MKQEESIALFRYWNMLRNGRPAPKKREIEPAQIKAILADTFILERASRRARFRLAGTRVGGIFGRELKGCSFDGLFSGPDRHAAGRLIMGVLANRDAATLIFEGATRGGRSARFEMVLLPLDGGPNEPRCLGLVAAIEKPFWLGADPVVEARIESMGTIAADSVEIQPVRRSGIEVPPLSPQELPVGEAQVVPRRTRRVRHLVVLDGGRKE
jgi:hypothetical protein